MFFSDEYFADPHPVLARVREKAPVQRITDPGGRAYWAITRYADARAALADPRLRKRFSPPDQLFHMLNSDPPDHTRLRKPLTSTFTARRVESPRPWITKTTAELLDAARDPFDLVASQRAHSGDGLLSALVTDGRLTDQELVDTALLVLTAGYETTVNLITNGVLALLRHPEALAELRADRSRLPGVIEEVLRFDGPLVFATPRRTAENVEIAGTTIPAGSAVLISLAAANRDPAHFPDPDAFRPTRPNGHLAFGHGIHFCLGAPLARLEAEIAFTALLDRYPKWELAEPNPTYQHSVLFRSPTALPLRLTM